jgi:hypothetical protein
LQIIMAQLVDYGEISYARTSANKKESGKPSQNFFDVNLLVNPSAENKTGDLDVIVFQNYYTGSLSIYQQNSSLMYTAVLENYKLMDNCFTEARSQNWFTIHVKELNSNYIKGRPLRFMLFQPATIWSKFEIRNLKFLSKEGGGNDDGNGNGGGTPSGSKSASPRSNNASTVLSDNLIEVLFSDLLLLKEVAASQVNMKDVTASPEDLVANADNKAKSAKKASKKKVAAGAAASTPTAASTA